MYTTKQYYLAFLWATGAYALFPDCTNGPLKNETICNPSACMLQAYMLSLTYILIEQQHRLIAPSPW